MMNYKPHPEEDIIDIDPAGEYEDIVGDTNGTQS